MTATSPMLDDMLALACAIDAGERGSARRGPELARLVLELDAALKAGAPLPEAWLCPVHEADDV